MKLFVSASIVALAAALPASHPPQKDTRGATIDLGGLALKRDANLPSIERLPRGATIDLGGLALKRDANLPSIERLPRGATIDLGGLALRRDDDAPLERLPRGATIDLGGLALRRDANPEAPVVPISSTPRRHNAEENYAKRDDGADLGVLDTVNSALAGVCQQIGGTMTTQTVCQTVSGSDISVTAADGDQTAVVTVSGRGLLQDASVTVPVESLDDILNMLA
ncbi:hypothetical protein KC320_g4741 [Hortaea werneckii]|nr:hypothetical protein KC320_g4741 [Hortaea werneckii]